MIWWMILRLIKSCPGVPQTTASSFGTRRNLLETFCPSTSSTITFQASCASWILMYENSFYPFSFFSFLNCLLVSSWHLGLFLVYNDELRKQKVILSQINSTFEKSYFLGCPKISDLIKYLKHFFSRVISMKLWWNQNSKRQILHCWKILYSFAVLKSKFCFSLTQRSMLHFYRDFGEIESIVLSTEALFSFFIWFSIFVGVSLVDSILY